MWRGVTGSLGPCDGGGIARMAVGSQCCSWACKYCRGSTAAKTPQTPQPQQAKTPQTPQPQQSRRMFT